MEATLQPERTPVTVTLQDNFTLPPFPASMAARGRTLRKSCSDGARFQSGRLSPFCSATAGVEAIAMPKAKRAEMKAEFCISVFLPRFLEGGA